METTEQRYEIGDELPEEYRHHLVHLMTMQADSELAGGLGYVKWIGGAPTMKEKFVMAKIVKDEIGHAHMMYRLLSQLGIDIDRHIEEHQMGDRLDIFYYDIPTWNDLVMFNFLMDRGAGHQLVDARECTYAPWARTIVRIEQEEAMHTHHGEQWVKRLAAEDPDGVTEALFTWWPRTLAIFGRARSPKNEVYRRLGLKRRTNEEVRQGFVDEVYALLDEYGLPKPPYDPAEYDMDTGRSDVQEDPMPVG